MPSRIPFEILDWMKLIIPDQWYCIKFKALNDINMDILKAAIRYGFEAQSSSISE